MVQGCITVSVLCLVVIAHPQVEVDPASAKAPKQAIKVDPRLPRYVPNKEGPVIGGVKTVNSDAMNNMLAFWAEGMLAHFPELQFEIEGKGGSTPPPALIAGNVSIGGMTRLFREDEATAFRNKWGYDATPLRVCIDLLAVYVHKDNPIVRKGLTHRELDAIFSKTRKTGAPADIKTWGDLGLDGDWKDKPIVLHGRNSASGSYGYFKFHGLAKGDFKDEVNEQPGSSAVVEAVGKDRYAIGYAGIAYRTDAVAPVPLARDEKSDAVPPVAEKVDDYLLGRHFYLYVNFKPGSNLEPVRREYLRYVFSVDGQNDVVKDGYLPIDAATAKNEAAKVGIEIEVKK